MPETLAQTLHDRPGEQTFKVDTSGDIIKPFLNPIHRLVDEARLWIDEDGWHVTAADPANVGGIAITLHADAFDSYTVDERIPYGVTIGSLKHHVKRARMSADDTLLIEGFENQLDTTVRRETDVGTITFENWMRTIDPDAIRGEPDIKLGPSEHDYIEHSVDLPMDVLEDTLGVLATDYEHVYVGSRDGTFAIWNRGDKQKTDYPDSGVVRFDDLETGTDIHSIYSSDYLVDLIPGLKASKADDVTLWYGSEVPMFLEAKRYVNDAPVMELTYMLAPRIEQ